MFVHKGPTADINRVRKRNNSPDIAQQQKFASKQAPNLAMSNEEVNLYANEQCYDALSFPVFASSFFCVCLTTLELQD